ncbi:MAG: pyridoxamine 5'-phosphate oxidase family protein [Saprospiraceae bacterium]|nr:pyridoxamine 5'-phosphate oxidase family protein [Saprospiraceae bacterium]
MIDFINSQKMYFVATAGADTRINLSPKGLDTFHIIDNSTVIWMNLTGSGNETAAHVLEHPRMTIMFCAFEGKPLILRLYGKARAVYKGDDRWDEYIQKISHTAGARQIFEVKLEMVQTSCGFGVPLYEYQGQRELLDKWSSVKGDEGLKNYWKEKNTTSIDGKPTGIKL